MRCIFLLLSILISAANAQYQESDFIDEMIFTDSDLDSASNIVYFQQSTKELISSGKVIVISFFNPG